MSLPVDKREYVSAMSETSLDRSLPVSAQGCAHTCDFDNVGDNASSTTAGLSKSRQRKDRTRKLHEAAKRADANAGRDKARAAVTANLDKQIAQLELELQQAREEKKAILEREKDTAARLHQASEKLQQQKLRNLTVLGKVKEVRRQQGLASDDEADDLFVDPFQVGKPDRAAYSSSPSAPVEESDEEAEEESFQEDSIEEMDGSNSDSDGFQIVSLLQTQVAGIVALLQLSSFCKAADPHTIKSLKGLHDHACDACKVFHDNYDEAAICSWIQVLQRHLGKAVLETADAVINDITGHNGTLMVEGVPIQVYDHAVWKALSWKDRHTISKILESSKEKMSSEANGVRGPLSSVVCDTASVLPSAANLNDSVREAARKSNPSTPVLSEIDVELWDRIYSVS